MGIIKDQIKSEIQKRIRDELAKKNQEKLPIEKNIGGFISNVGKNITDISKGIIGLGYQAVRHPVESTKNVVSAGTELIKTVPKATQDIVQTYTHPIETVKRGVTSYQKLKDIPFDQQKKIFNNATQQLLQNDERGKRILGVLGVGMLGAGVQEITHPLKYAYENPVNFALDVLTVGQGSGVNKFVSGVAKTAIKDIPAVVKVQSALKEVFLPNGKLINAGYNELSQNLMKTKSEIFKVQKQIVEDTANKFYKEFKLNPKEQTEFFETIDKLRRTAEPIKAISQNPKIQQAINWWLDNEVPILRQASGLPEKSAINNYLHHYFPEKFKAKDVNLTKPLQYSQKGYLKKSADVEGFTKDPVLSISAIKSKVAVDNLRDSFIKNTIDKYAVKTDTLAQQLTDAGVDITKLDRNGLIEKAKQVLNLEEYKPKGNLRFFPVITETGSEVAGVTTRVETHLMPKVIVEELNKFGTGGKSTIEKMFLPFDVFNRNWKPLATAVRLRYHTRNVLGNIYNATVVAGNNPISFVLKDMPIAGYQQIKSVISDSIKSNSILGQVYKKFFGNVVEPDIIKIAVDNDIIGRGFFGADISDLTTAINSGDDIMRTIKNINTHAEIATPIRPLGLILKNLKGKKIDVNVNLLGSWMRTMTKVGEFLEDNARLALFKQGLKKFNGDISLSKNYVKKHLFDYLTGLGEADRVIKRFIPFWSWTRFNIPLQTGSLLKTPLRYAAIQKSVEPYRREVELTDEGYQYLTPEQQSAGFIKIGTSVTKGGKEYDKYIKTASVLPLDDLSRLVDILRGKDEEIGITPLRQIYNLITSDPTKFKDYFGQPIESFSKEKTKFLGLEMRGKNKALLSTIPFLTEINKLIGGGYTKKEKPMVITRVEQILSPLGTSLVNKESNKFFSELEKEKELTGSYTLGLESIYKKYLKLDIENKGSEKYVTDNIKILETILRQKGLNDFELLKIKNSAIKKIFQDAFKIK